MTMSATLTRSTTLTLIGHACARCGAVRPAAAVTGAPNGDWRCVDFHACAQQRAVNRRVSCTPPVAESATMPRPIARTWCERWEERA